jgi:hypothetical protein
VWCGGGRFARTAAGSARRHTGHRILIRSFLGFGQLVFERRLRDAVAVERFGRTFVEQPDGAIRERY